jgi:uracil-DNA glycosylase family 4
MEEQFKEGLKSLKMWQKATTFADEILPGADWVVEAENATEQALSRPQEEIKGERKQVLESLQDFAQKKLDDAGKTQVNFENIAITKKEPAQEADELLIDGAEKLTQEEFEEMFSHAEVQGIEERYLDSRLQKSDSVKVLFVTDKFRSPDEIEEAQDEFDYFFEAETAALFRKMVTAMKLDSSEFLISAVGDEHEQDFDFLEEELAYFTPEVVMTLGATASNKLLGTKQRLSAIHGNFYTKGIKYFDSSSVVLAICPIFHPEFLRINPNMKKTAWEDMQKVMKKLNKI